jgi:molybdopterin-containing oxidoreductase family membrane subunit
MKPIVYREWHIPPTRYWGILGILTALAGLGVLAATAMEIEGHWVTGMNHAVVWGLPHVFADFLIIAASGVLNAASLATAFERRAYRPLGRLSALMALALLIGGLVILVLDLGHPERLTVAMTHLNFSSLFAWNVLLYSGFVVLAIATLWSLTERMGAPFTKPIGALAFVWRIALTTGTGSILGVLVSRQAFDTTFLAPLFILLSLAYGLAVFLLVLLFCWAQEGRRLDDPLIQRLKNQLGGFVSVVLYGTVVYFLTKTYDVKGHDWMVWLLFRGGFYSVLFWVGWVLIGTLAPLGIIWHPVLGRDRRWIVAACALVILGGLATLYVLLVASQVYPLPLFPGHAVLDSGFVDGFNGGIAHYRPSVPEVLLGLGGVAVALIITALGVRLLQILPESLADATLSADDNY